jgi:protein SCO1/2
MTDQNKKRVALLGLLVLPVLVYIAFVYLQKGVFFKTLDHVGPYTVEQVDGVNDTVYYKVPKLTFENQFGNTYTQDSITEGITVVSFFFTSCPSICPAMNFHLKQVSDRFKGVDYFNMVSITVDPERDTLEALQEYARKLGVQERRWWFLRGTQEEAHQLAPKFFLAANEDSTAAGGYNHSHSVVVLDGNGNIRSRKDDNGNIVGSYDAMSVSELNKMEDDIKVLIAEYERWKHYQLKFDD